jgi:hypothetical protein
MADRMGSKKVKKTLDLPDDIAAVELFFAFPDGVYHYVCAECNALCCRGHGLSGSLQKQLPVVLTLYPVLETLTLARSGDVVIFDTTSDGCPLLDSDNFCRIEKEHGKALKPGLCSLFPFNLFRRIGRTIAILPHFLCPLRLQIPARPGQVEGTHAAIDVAFRESGLFEPRYVSANVPPLPLHPSIDAEAVIRRETDFRDTCSRALTQTMFSEVLRKESADPARLAQDLERSTRILGLPAPAQREQRDPIDDLMLALASPIRLSLLHLSSEGIIRALALGEILIRRVSSLSGRPMSPQAAYNFLQGRLNELRMLARADEKIEISAKAKLDPPPFGDPGLTFSSFIFLREVQKSTPVLQALEKAVTPTLTISDRSALVIQLGAILEQALSTSHRKRRVSRKGDLAESESALDQMNGVGSSGKQSEELNR